MKPRYSTQGSLSLPSLYWTAFLLVLICYFSALVSFFATLNLSSIAGLFGNKLYIIAQATTLIIVGLVSFGVSSRLLSRDLLRDWLWFLINIVGMLINIVLYRTAKINMLIEFSESNPLILLSFSFLLFSIVSLPLGYFQSLYLWGMSRTLFRWLCTFCSSWGILGTLLFVLMLFSSD
jgi:hypothetical protein